MLSHRQQEINWLSARSMPAEMNIVVTSLADWLADQGRMTELERGLQAADYAGLARHAKRQAIQKIGRYYRRQLLAQVLGCSPELLQFSQTEYGKPMVQKPVPLQFNQSHSDTMFALAWSLSGFAVGIDIEDKQRVFRQPELARHVLTPAEYQCWQYSSEPHEYWLKLWTVKEAVLKACGLGIRLNLNELETDLFPEQHEGTLRHPRIGAWCYRCFDLTAQILSISWPAGSPQTSIKMTSIDAVL